MDEIFLLAVMLFLAYLFISTTCFLKSEVVEQEECLTPQPKTKVATIPEDSVLRRHFIAQLRSQIEREMYPRPVDPILRRLYESMVDDELNSLLANLAV